MDEGGDRGGAGWPTPLPTPARVSGETIRPPAPVALSAAVGGGGLALSWVRRSRAGWSWADDMDAPLGEAREAYRVTVIGSAETATFECDSPSLVLAAADLAPLGSGAATISVRQLGDRAVSRAASLSITLN